MFKQRPDDFQRGVLEEAMPAGTRAGWHSPGREHHAVLCRAMPRRAAPGLPRSGGMSGQVRVYRAVMTNPHSLTLGAVPSRFSPL